MKLTDRIGCLVSIDRATAINVKNGYALICCMVDVKSQNIKSTCVK